MTENPAAKVVIDLVEQQHKLLDSMLENLSKAGEAQRKAYASSLNRFLSAHEAAEATYIEKAQLGQEQAERWVQRLGEIDLKAPDFKEQFAKFQEDLKHHTETETKFTLPKALKDLSNAQIELIQAAFERVSNVAEPADDSDTGADPTSTTSK